MKGAPEHVAHVIPQRLALFPETSVTWDPLALYKAGTTTPEVKPSWATTWLSPLHCRLAPRCLAFPLTQFHWLIGFSLLSCPCGHPNPCRGTRQEVHAHHVRFFTSSPLSLPRKPKHSECVLQCAYAVFNLVFAVLSALIRKTVQRDEPFLGPKSRAANN